MKNQATETQKVERMEPYSNTNKRDIPPNYKTALSLYVKPSLNLIYDQLAENLEGMDGEVNDPVMVDDLLGAFRGALRLWDYIDETTFKEKEV